MLWDEKFIKSQNHALDEPDERTDDDRDDEKDKKAKQRLEIALAQNQAN